MPEHEISMGMPRATVMNSDVEFEVRSDGALLGRLLVSRGALEWRPRYGREAHVIEWENFADFMSKQPVKPG